MNDNNLNTEIIEVDEAFIKKTFSGREIIDKGTAIVNTKKDYELFLKYIENLSADDESYKPAGLQFEQKATEKNNVKF